MARDQVRIEAQVVAEVAGDEELPPNPLPTGPAHLATTALVP
jgi:hypothetical protein